MSASRNSDVPSNPHNHGHRKREKVNSVSPRRLIGSCDRTSGVTETGTDARLIIEWVSTWRDTGCPGSYPMNILRGFLIQLSSIRRIYERRKKSVAVQLEV
jgi:hypothetical protein